MILYKYGALYANPVREPTVITAVITGMESSHTNAKMELYLADGLIETVPAEKEQPFEPPTSPDETPLGSAVKILPQLMHTSFGDAICILEYFCIQIGPQKDPVTGLEIRNPFDPSTWLPGEYPTVQEIINGKDENESCRIPPPNWNDPLFLPVRNAIPTSPPSGSITVTPPPSATQPTGSSSGPGSSQGGEGPAAPTHPTSPPPTPTPTSPPPTPTPTSPPPQPTQPTQPPTPTPTSPSGQGIGVAGNGGGQSQGKGPSEDG
jgi:hypothetical protein